MLVAVTAVWGFFLSLGLEMNSHPNGMAKNKLDRYHPCVIPRPTLSKMGNNVLALYIL